MIHSNQLLSSMLLLLLVSCLLGSASAEQGRKLTATPLNCRALHDRCSSCAMATKPGTKTSYVKCTQCDASPAGYTPYTNLVVTPIKSTCACMPGYFSRVATPKVCEVCPKESFCAGGVAAGATKVYCGAGATTTTTGTKTAASCINKPGYGYYADSTVPLGFTTRLCPAGSYSAGGDKKPCVPCPASLTTSSDGSTSITQCLAQPGYFFVGQGKQPLPCPVGTYKGGFDQAPSCTPCPAGLTTQGQASVSVSACMMATTRGYYVTTENNNKVAKPCPIGTWSSNFLTCTECTEGTTTAREGATGSAECLAPPGYGYNPGRQGNIKTYLCPNGYYKAGWNKLDCASCGTNYQTDTSATNGLGLTADQCFILAGWGSAKDSAGKLVAKLCVAGRYGVSDRTYGNVSRPCLPCPENTVTSDQFVAPATTGNPPYTSADSCLCRPGWGWYNKVATICAVGYWKGGYNNMDCAACGAGLTTATPGADDPSLCVPLPSWAKEFPADDFASPCNVGYWSQGGDGASCLRCPEGSTSDSVMSASPDQCALCAPGWGQGPATTGPGLCSVCPPTYFGPGGSDNPCLSCEAGTTSPYGASDSSDCFDEMMPTTPYDFINTPALAWVAATDPAVGSDKPDTDPASADECEAACKNAHLCQYYAFREDQDAADDNGCFFKLAAQTSTTTSFASLKLFAGDYVVYPAAENEYPTPEELQFTGLDPNDPGACHDACDDLASCLAVFITRETNGASWACYRVEGDYATSGTITSAVKANPLFINGQPWR